IAPASARRNKESVIAVTVFDFLRQLTRHRVDPVSSAGRGHRIHRRTEPLSGPRLRAAHYDHAARVGQKVTWTESFRRLLIKSRSISNAAHLSTKCDCSMFDFVFTGDSVFRCFHKGMYSKSVKRKA